MGIISFLKSFMDEISGREINSTTFTKILIIAGNIFNSKVIIYTIKDNV